MAKYIQIKPELVGELVCFDPQGSQKTPKDIYFFIGSGRGDEGYALTTIVTRPGMVQNAKVLRVVTDSRGGTHYEQFSRPGYAGLVCDYDERTGTLRNFRDE